MTGSKPAQRLRILYVCDFQSIHARSLVEHFAGQPERYVVHVFSTTTAPPMAHVTVDVIFNGKTLKHRLGQGRWQSGLVRMLQRMPSAQLHLRAREKLSLSKRMVGCAMERLHVLDGCDVIHALRLQPEGLVGAALKRARPEVPLVLTTWGQDFGLYGTSSRAMARATREAVQAADGLHTDNVSDARLAREQFRLRESAATVLAPATGGLDLEALPRPASSDQSPGRAGPPRLLCVRGYENAYVRIRVLIRAFEQFLRRYPDAHLSIDVSKSNQDADRDAVMERWIRRSTARHHIALLHLDRAELFESMQGCHLYVSATRCDGVSISLLEAIYLGMVPVVSRHEATASLLEQVQGAVQVGHLQAAEFASGFAEAYEFARTSKSFADHNRQVIRDRFSREKNILRIEGLYHELAARKRGSEDRLPQLLRR